VPFKARADSQTIGHFTVTAAVPGADENQAIFGLPLYEHGIQPVWLEIQNRGDEQVRFAPVSVDRDYYSPLEVSFTLRKGFSASAREEMDQRFHELAITRTVDPGETISGFVFTHLSPGTKSFNVDLFGGETQQNFAFFIDVPGFVPDHSKVNFETLYSQDEIQNLDAQGLRDAINSMPCCTDDADHQADGLPINVVIIGKGLDVLRALLRADWYESHAGSQTRSGEGKSANYLYGRPPDAVFRIGRDNGKARNELQVWLSPLQIDGDSVWLGQVANLIGQDGKTGTGFLLDPDLDDARGFLMENMWYSQGLQGYAWIKSSAPISSQQAQSDFQGHAYYSDGYRAVLWLSGIPVSLLKTSIINWDEAPLE
jgi:hypothetical protein